MEAYPVALAEFGSSPSMLVLVVPALEAAWCVYLDDPDVLGTRVAQRVIDAFGLDYVGADRSDHDLTAHIARQLALQYVVALMLPTVGMRRYHNAGRKPPLHDGD